MGPGTPTLRYGYSRELGSSSALWSEAPEEQASPAGRASLWLSLIHLRIDLTPMLSCHCHENINEAKSAVGRATMQRKHAPAPLLRRTVPDRAVVTLHPIVGRFTHCLGGKFTRRPARRGPVCRPRHIPPQMTRPGCRCHFPRTIARPCPGRATGRMVPRELLSEFRPGARRRPASAMREESTAPGPPGGVCA